ncbi:MAG TPA: hypothetical protein RMH99_27965 [Sandaracinaceae bacterium LLY-WYZ-13_1]|nr:hypothetical protein [Sandaracinaceae bacterium LLY-WYZ-13_1]
MPPRPDCLSLVGRFAESDCVAMPGSPKAMVARTFRWGPTPLLAPSLIAVADPRAEQVLLYAAGHDGVGSWDAPVSIATLDVPRNDDSVPGLEGPVRVAMRTNLLWVDGGGLYHIGNPHRPTRLVSAEEWFHRGAEGPQNPMTELGCLRHQLPLDFHPDGRTLHFPRFPMAQVVDASACAAP